MKEEKNVIGRGGSKLSARDAWGVWIEPSTCAEKERVKPDGSLHGHASFARPQKQCTPQSGEQRLLSAEQNSRDHQQDHPQSDVQDACAVVAGATVAQASVATDVVGGQSVPPIFHLHSPLWQLINFSARDLEFATRQPLTV